MVALVGLMISLSIRVFVLAAKLMIFFVMLMFWCCPAIIAMCTKSRPPRFRILDLI